jgi:hypothetical protein
VKLHELNWGRVVPWLQPWRELTPQAREVAAFTWRDQALAWSRILARDRKVLTWTGAVEDGPAGGRGNDPSLAPGFRDLLQAIRLTAESGIIDWNDPEDLHQYVTEQLPGEHLRRVLPPESPPSARAAAREAASPDRLRRFLEDDRAAPGIWARALGRSDQGGIFDRVPGEGSNGEGSDGEGESAGSGDASLQLARAVVRVLAESEEPVSLRDLGARLSDPADEWGQVVGGLLGGLLALPWLDDELEIHLVLWPRALRRLRTGGGPPSELAEPPGPGACRPFLVDDMATLLVAAGAQPMRLRRSDHAFYARDRKRIAGELTPLPQPLRDLSEYSEEYRIGEAARWLQRMDLVRVEDRGDEGIIFFPTGEGRQWLAGSPVERLRSVLTPLRQALAEPDEPALVEALPGAPGLYLYGSLRDRALAAVPEAFAALPDRPVVPLDPFLEHLVEEENPLLDPSVGQQMAAPFRIWGMDPEERARFVWHTLLVQFLLQRLVPLGCVQVASPPDDGAACIGLAPSGRYLLGLEDELTWDPETEDADIRVTPDFEVVFLSPAPAAEAAISRFAERLGSGVGALFRITPDAVRAAAAAGLTPEGVLDSLGGLAAGGVPENVEGEIRRWMDSCRRVRARTVRVIDCGDPETADRALAAGGKELRRIAPSLLEVSGGKLRAVLVRKLAEAGVFVDAGREG